MRVLVLHDRYLVPGGEEQTVAAETSLLRELGHRVELLEQDNRDIQALGRFTTARRAVWSSESHSRVVARLARGDVDVVHVHNFFPLWSPAIYYAAAETRIPVVQTLHNFRLLCVNATFFRDGRACQDCLHSAWPWRGVVHGCYRHNRSGSAAVAAMVGLHRLRKTWQRRVQVYIAPSDFARETFIAGGLPAEKIVVKPHFVHPTPPIGTGDGGYAIFVGRLEDQKGVLTMLRAWQNAKRPLRLKVIGDGALAQQVRDAAARSGSIDYLGRLPGDEVLRHVAHAEFLLFPSECHETMGRAIMEAFAVGTPVLAAKIGAPATMVRDRHTGFHFTAGDVLALREAVQRHTDDPTAFRALRGNARLEFEAKYSAAANAQQLLAIYHRAGAGDRTAEAAVS